MIKKTAAVVIAITIILPVRSWSQWTTEGSTGVLSCLVCIASPLIIFFKGASFISDFRTTDVNINGVEAEFQTNTVVPNKNLNEAILEGELTESVTVPIHGVQVRINEGLVKFHENGKLYSCSIGPATLLTGGNERVQTGGYVEFHDNEYLKSISLDRYKKNAYKVQGIDRSLGHMRELTFHKNGVISGCHVNDEGSFKAAGYSVQVPAGSHLGFGESGLLTMIEPDYKKAVSLKFRGRQLSFSKIVKLHENGIIRQCSFPSPIDIQNGRYALKIHRDTVFYDTGTIEECMLASPHNLNVNGNNIRFKGNEYSFIKQSNYDIVERGLRFFSNGNIESGITASGSRQFYTHRGLRIELNDNSRIYFHEYGGLKMMYPEEGAVILAGGQKLILATDLLEFDDSGNLTCAGIRKGSSFDYAGRIFQMDVYSGKIFFDKNRKITAFQHASDHKAVHRGQNFTLPKFSCAGYSDVVKNEISFVNIYKENLDLPRSITLETDNSQGFTYIFVKADRYFTVKKKNLHEETYTALKAQGVREIMLSRAGALINKGIRKSCGAMEWIAVSGE